MPPPQPPPTADEIHLWHAHLDALAPHLPNLRRLLSPDEQLRAERFIADLPRRDFCLSRGILRLLLESYGVAPAAEIRFTYSATGKPALDTHHPAHPLQFNLSHSRGIAVYAFAAARDVGIDVEAVRDVPDADQIVAGQFAREERDAYFALPASARHRALFATWTRKEAFLKAVGVGLSRLLDSFAVTVNPDEPPRLLRVDDDAAAASEWTLAEWAVPPNYQMAIAVRGAGPFRFVQREVEI